MEKIILLGDGSLLKGIIILPFAISGLILMFKGAIAHLEKLEQKYPELSSLSQWKVGLLGLFLLFSYLAVFYAASRLL